ncbi:MAG TPA: hypothetical protein V6D11_06415 [Waterburya sp.]|jgi:hypothetical protein
MNPRTSSSITKFFNQIDNNILVILILPILLILLNKDWIFFTINHQIDPGVYLGYFLNLKQNLQTFADTYYGTRLSWILLGYLAYHLFPPLLANYALRIGLYYASVISLYLILKYTVSRRAALITSIFMGYYSYFLLAIGWDYVDGVGIAYYLLTMLMLTLSIKSYRWKYWLCLSGFFYGALIYSNLFWLTFTPLIVIYFVLGNREFCQNSLITSFFNFTVGFFSITILLGTINYFINNQFFFFLPSFQFASANINQSNPWKTDFLLWIHSASWLIMPATTFLVSLTYLVLTRPKPIKKSNKFAGIFAIIFILQFLIMVAWELKGNPVLQLPFYASYLIPSMFLALGAICFAGYDKLKDAQFKIVCCISVFSILFLISIKNTFILRNFSYIKIFLVTGLIFLIFKMIFVLFINKNQKRKNNPIYYFLTSLFAFSILNYISLYNSLTLNEFPKNQDSFLAVMDGIKAIQKSEDSKNLRFWYSSNSPLSKVYRSIAASYLWEYRLISDNYPSLKRNSKPDNPINNNTNLVILSDGNKTFENADAALRRVGLKAKLLSEKNIHEGTVNFKITFIETQLNISLSSSPTLRVQDFSKNWEKTNYLQNMIVDKAAGTVGITTNRSAYDFQLVSRPVKVKPQAKYLMQFDLKIEKGGAGVHILGADRKTVIASHYWCEPNTKFSQEQFLIDTANNSELSLVISNCGHPKPEVSTFWVKNLEIWQTKPVDSR